MKTGPKGLEKAQMEAQKCTEKKAYRPGKHCSSAKSLFKSTASLIRPVIGLLRANGAPSLNVPKKAKKVPHFFQRKKWGSELGKA